MTEEQGAGSTITRFVQELNLPHLIAGPAGNALSRLIGGAVDIPAAKLDQFAQGIRDKTSARTVVSKAVAEAAAKLASGNPDIVERAAHNLLAKEVRKQLNKEAVALKTIEYLNDEPEAAAQSEDVDADWLNMFERYAEDASSERMQDLWARILAGEIRKPKAFSLRTLSFISQLDEDVASLFERYSDAVLDGRIIPIKPPMPDGRELMDMLTLEEAGLVKGAGASLGQNLMMPSQGMLVFRYPTHAFVLYGRPDTRLQISMVPLTRVGREVFSILRPKPNLDRAKAFADWIPKQDGLERILYGKREFGSEGQEQLASPEVLWEKPESTVSQ
jgi:Protein of unknown function (DUF2806)